MSQKKGFGFVSILLSLVLLGIVIGIYVKSTTKSLKESNESLQKTNEALGGTASLVPTGNDPAKLNEQIHGLQKNLNEQSTLHEKKMECSEGDAACQAQK